MSTRDNHILPKDKVPAFVKLVEALRVHYGYEGAAKKIGIASGHLRNICVGYQNLPVSRGWQILAAYKAMKEESKCQGQSLQSH